MKKLTLLLTIIPLFGISQSERLSEDYIMLTGKETIWDLEFMPGQDEIIAASAHGRVIRVDATTGKELASIGHKKQSVFQDLSINTKGDKVALASHTNGVMIADLNTNEFIKNFSAGETVNLVEWHPLKDNKLVVVYFNNGKSYVTLYDSEKGREEKIILSEQIGTEVPTVLRFNPKGDIMAMGSANKNHSVKFYDTETWKEIKRLDLDTDVVGMDWHPLGNKFVIGTFDNNVAVYTYPELKQEWKKAYGTKNPSDCKFNPQGTQIATCGRHYGYKIRTFDAETGEVLQDINKKNPNGNRINWNATGDKLAFASTTYGDAFSAAIVQIFITEDHEKNRPWYTTDPHKTTFKFELPAEPELIEKSDSYYSYQTYNLSYGQTVYQIYIVTYNSPVSEDIAIKHRDNALNRWINDRKGDESEVRGFKAGKYTGKEAIVKKGSKTYREWIIHTGKQMITLYASTREEMDEIEERFFTSFLSVD